MPAASICTEPFRLAADAMARSYGFPDFPYVVTEHPVASLSREEVRDRVTVMLPRILEILGVSVEVEG
ncbi:hypothetical protein [Pseudonocardia sp. MH-G8]|uniref:UGSC family (seleno)protein n=1 Tax=Pseudonocardia sp. MH-G8 TaxID=1854588 RepID=UPI000BA013C2|nr:hypothetical protein [Pseudonocardia sp. MH-G8]OZM83244.1 hypothetical protein CFP66_01440 [Pseudonocardia sp. MH-G8]